MKKVVLAYSGGLDTSVAVAWLHEQYDTEVARATRELAPGRHLVFAACGVTDGDLLQGVRFTGDGTHTHSVVMTSTPARVRFIDTTHLENKPDVKVRFR